MTKSLHLHVSIEGGCFCLFYFLAYATVIHHEWRNSSGVKLDVYGFVSETIPKGLNFHVITVAHLPLCATR